LIIVRVKVAIAALRFDKEGLSQTTEKLPCPPDIEK
jgi:hypothetical protein